MNKIKTVLLIDDDEPTNFINKKIIQSSDLVEAIHVAHGGGEALQLLGYSKGGEFPVPDLIFLDVNMPAMDGWEFLDHYKKLTGIPSTRIVIIMLTTSLNPDDEGRASEVEEVSEYRNKPLTRQMLEEVIKKYF